MGLFANLADLKAIEAEKSWDKREIARSIHGFLCCANDAYGVRPAISFQLFSGPKDKALTMTWGELFSQVTQAANLFRSLGVGEGDVVACVLPNCLETVVALLGGAVAGIVTPINPLLEAEQISAILRETKAKIVVTLRAFPKTDVAQKVAEALCHAPGVKVVLEVDLMPYLAAPMGWMIPVFRPKNHHSHSAVVKDFRSELAAQRADVLNFVDEQIDRVAAYFHTGGTTGMPKMVKHKVSGMVYNGWLGARLLFRETDVVMCPLPLFHVFAVYPILMSMIESGAHVVFPTPAGYRGEGVMDNLWKLVQRWKCTYLITVPTALAMLMQRPINADISTLKNVFSGSASMPVEVYSRFLKVTGIETVEGYGLTECTCLVAVNPPGGTKKIGSVGLPLPYTHVRILQKESKGFRECAVDEVGEICVSSPGVYEGLVYTEADKNYDLFAEGRFLRTGDLGRLDAEGYLFITGRAKDLIIRGGHNIDPLIIEEALIKHEAVAVVGAIGQPDAYAGELPCAYVELVAGREVTAMELLAFAQEHISERAAVPKYIEVLDKLPKTALGKVFKPDLRRLAIARVYDAVFAEVGLIARVAEVIEDSKRGSVVRVICPVAEGARVQSVLGQFAGSWEIV